MPEEVILTDWSGSPLGTVANPLEVAGGGGGGGGGGAVTLVDGADATQGASTNTAASPTIMGRLLKLIALLPATLGQKLSAASLAVVIASDQSDIPISGTVTANAGTGTQATSVVDGADAALGSTGDASSGFTVVALLKNIKAALAGTLTISGAVTNSNIDVALSTRLKPADTLAGITTVAAVTAITNPLPAGTNAIGGVTIGDGAALNIGAAADTAASTTLMGRLLKIAALLPAALGQTTKAGSLSVALASDQGTLPVGQKAQTTVTTTMQTAATANGNGTVVTTDGYNGAILIFISNSTGTATVTIEGSLDSAFTTPQDVIPLGLYKLADNTATNTSRSIVSGAIPVAASSSYLYAVADSFPYIRARISGQASLAALTVKCYAVPN